ncbi:MAG: alanine racemase [Gammaproteobacteria bacterium]|nr:alanine racemase [Gammaproteobacteria bacterium]MBU1646675.1 alanine racemase [Gammaproteobacteria bacterium]MBU1971708.1 alanine racemase [Gammaproteobacteria bacterium]
MSRPIRARIDLAALRHNHAIARRHAGEARIWSVVKANAYGHGLLRVAAALADTTDGFALIELDGAIALRSAGIRQPILMLEGFYEAEELPAFDECGLTTVIHSRAQAEAFCAAALPCKLPVYLKLNTGMNRLGLDPDEVPAVRDMIERSRLAASVTLMTHFADADGPRGVDWQMDALAGMAGNGPRSLANSAGLLRHHQTQGDWVRPGIMLYGSSPFPEQTAAELGLKPVMTLESQLIAVRDIAPGERVGYGGAFTAEKPMTIGVVACGYADGYPRHAPNGAPVLVAGQRCGIVGRVSMDKICIDLTDLPQKVGAGETAILWGEGLPADEVAAAAGTISYELFCGLAARVPVTEVN